MLRYGKICLSIAVIAAAIVEGKGNRPNGRIRMMEGDAVDNNDRYGENARAYIKRSRVAYEGPAHRIGRYYEYEESASGGSVDIVEKAYESGSGSSDASLFSFGVTEYDAAMAMSDEAAMDAESLSYREDIAVSEASEDSVPRDLARTRPDTLPDRNVEDQRGRSSASISSRSSVEGEVDVASNRISNQVSSRRVIEAPFDLYFEIRFAG
jgi:hypothetical protein